MTIEDIRNEVLEEVGGDSSDSTLKSFLFNRCKAGLRRFPLYLRSRLLMKTWYGTLADGNYTMELPSDFVRERQIYRKSDGNRINIMKKEGEAFNEFINNKSGESGTVDYYRIVGDYIEFNVRSNGAETIYIEGFKEVDDVALTDNFFGDSTMVEILKDLVKFYYFDYEEDTNRADRHFLLAREGFEELNDRYARNELPDYVVEG